MADRSDNAVQDALNEALKDGETDSQSATGQDTDVAAALKGALESPEDKSASEDLIDDDDADDTSKGSKTVPYDRLRKVVQQKNEAGERLKALESQFKTANDREQELTAQIKGLQNDKQMLDAIKNLHQDERYRPMIENLDRALQGIDEEIEVAQDDGDDKATKDLLKKFEAKTAELDSLMADQRADGLWDKTAGRAKSMLDALPEAYSDEDRAILGEMWTPRVDWDGIEEAGEGAISPALNESFAKVIKRYGTPKGAIVAQTTEEIEEQNPEVKIVSDEDKVQAIMDKNWAELDENGKPLMSQEDFDSDLADLLRVVNKR